MLQTIESINNVVNNFIWGVPAMICIIGVGLYLSLRTGFVQIRKFPYALKTTLGRIFKKKEASDGSMTPFQAVCTALAGTVGTGNIAGVAGAIAIGGPGAVFWMWISALLGMCTKFTEVTLAVHFRERNRHGDYVGGPMYYIKNGLGKNWRFLAVLYSAFGVLTVFGTGNATQVNTITTAIDTALINFNVISESSTGRLNLILGIVITLLVGMVLLGGIKRIGSVSEKLVPFMALFYIVLALGVVILNIGRVPAVFHDIVYGAFNPSAVTGGVIGSFFLSMKKGVSRGIFSNEAGLGTGSIAHACADTSKPVKQGMFGIFEVFADTIVICTLTGFVVIMGRMWTTDRGAEWFDMGKLDKFLASCGELTGQSGAYQIVTFLVSICFGLFAFTCLIGFMSFTEMCAVRISSRKGFIVLIRLLCLFVISFGVITNIAGMDLGALWDLSDFANILMVYCNLPLQYLGLKYVTRAWKHFEKQDGTPFTSEIAGIDVPVWEEKAGKA